MSNNSTDLNKLKHLLYSCYTIETCYHSVKDEWTEENKTLGQDTLTSIIIKDYFGGLIKRCYIEEKDYYHFFNIVGDKIVDFTKEQFKDKYFIPYDKAQTKSRAKLLDIVDLKNRYEKVCELIKIKSNKLNNLLKEMDNENINHLLFLNEDCKYLIISNDYITIEQLNSSPNLTEQDKKYLIENAKRISYLILDINSKTESYITELTNILNPYKVVKIKS
ncbi:MAG: hypothetical protein IJZ29_05640 [Clostridia bacterium]|nr:hypothetical protein [Clostridia bacterium]